MANDDSSPSAHAVLRLAVGSIAVALLIAVHACRNRAVPDAAAPTEHPALLLWRVDVNGADGPSETLEAITATQVEGRKAWRVTHYPPDPTRSQVNEFDLYEVDAETFHPIRSVMQTPEFRLEIGFGPTIATLRRTTKNGASVERIPLQVPVMPEGPGNTVFIAGLPLSEKFAMRYVTLDRWDGNGTSCLKKVQLTVTGRKRITTLAGTKETFEVDVRAEDGSFRILAYVRTDPLIIHFGLYTRVALERS
jgi:hypothetical protein